MVEKIRLLDKGTTLENRDHHDGPQELERGVAQHSSLEPDGLQRHSGSRVPAESERASAQYPALEHGL